MIQLPYEGKVYVSSPYGNRVLNGKADWHPGLDLVGQTDCILRAPATGTVIASTMITDKSNRTWEWGNYICVTAEGYQIYMAHMRYRLITDYGAKVVAGQPIGIEGNTGYSFGQHCHLEIRKNGVAVDPCPILGIENKAGVTYQNYFSKRDEPMTAQELKKLIKECGPEIYRALAEYLAAQPESEWSRDEGHFGRATLSGAMDGTNPRGMVTREQLAAILGRKNLL